MAKASEKKKRARGKRKIVSPSDIVLKNGVPIPNRLIIRSHVDSLKVGGSLEMEFKHWDAMRNAASNAKKASGGIRKYTVHKIDEETIGLWRTA